MHRIYRLCIMHYPDALDLEWRKQGKEQRNLFAFLGQSKLYDVNDSKETSSDGISIPFKK